MKFFTQERSPEEWRALLAQAGHRGFHNFTFGCCAAYFGLLTGRPEWLDDHLLHITSPQGSHKTWIFGDAPSRTALPDLRRWGPVYSQIPLGITGGSKFKEVLYDLNSVVDPASYPSRKKRYRRLTYPPRWLSARGYQIEPLQADDLAEISDVHALWVEHKLQQESTYQIMFPRRRYLACCHLAAAYPQWFIGFKLVDQSGRIAGARVAYREGEWAFDLAQFVDPAAPSNTAEYFAFATMAEMRESGVRWLNCGASLNRHLSAFKSHWPSSVVFCWAYPRFNT